MNEFNRVLLSSPLYWFLVIGGIAAPIIYYVYGSKIVGWFGELWTKKELDKLPRDQYKVLNDVFIKVNDRSNQIDHVVVSPYGIFSIETKQYNGYITGGKYDKYWVRRIKEKEYYYTNPIRQNYGHIKALSQLLNIDEKKIYNVVCIPSRGTIKIQHDGEVVRYATLVDKITSYKEAVIENVEEIANEIIKNNITSKKERKEHIQDIKKNIINKDPNKCPKCGGQLVKRNGKYGDFMGCSNYPKCNYTRKI